MYYRPNVIRTYVAGIEVQGAIEDTIFNGVKPRWGSEYVDLAVSEEDAVELYVMELEKRNIPKPNHTIMYCLSIPTDVPLEIMNSEKLKCHRYYSYNGILPPKFIDKAIGVSIEY